MTKRKQPSKSRANSQAVKSVERDIAALRKKQRALLKKQGTSIVEFRSLVAKAKRAGIVSKKTDARKQEATRYMRGKLRKFADVLSGENIAVRAKPDVRQKYREKEIYETRGPFIIVPREYANQKTRIAKGKVEIRRALKNGEIIEIVLPWNAADLFDLANRLENDPTIPSDLDGVDQYAFSLFGHTSNLGFPNKEELVKHITQNYKHLFQGRSGLQGVKNFKLVRYGGGRNPPPEIPSDIAGEKFYSEKGSGRRPNATGRDWYQDKQRERKLARAKNRRDKMTPEQRAEYNAKGRARAAASYAKQRAERNDMGF